MNLKKYKLNGFRLVMNIWKSGTILVMIVSMCAMALSQTSAFTYQGKLNDGGVPANSTYDMQFKLFDALNAGTQIGVTQTVTSVQTVAGIFTVQLDFGAGAFTGADRFIEVSISPAGQNNFTPLAPRQSLTSAPYSVQATNAATAANAFLLGGLPASRFVETSDSRMSDARTPLPGSGNYIQNLTTPQAGVNFNIGGTGSANIMNAATQFNLNGTRILSAGGTNNLFAGGNAGVFNTTGTSNAFFGAGAGQGNTTGNRNAYFGAFAGSVNTVGFGNSFFGVEAGRNTTGSANSFFGDLTGSANTTGVSNAFYGRASGFSNTSGGGNSFFGPQSGFDNTIGTNNSFFGISSGTRNTTGIENSFFGNSAGGNNTTGSNNVFIGRNSGNPSTATQVNNSVAIGTSAIVSSSNTIVLGTSAHTTRVLGNFVVNPDQSAAFGLLGTVTASSGNGAWASNMYVQTFASGAGFPTPNVCRLAQGAVQANQLVICNTNFSSVNNKTNIQPFSAGLDVIRRLKPVTFRWKGDGTPDIGLNAEDVAEIAPSLINRGDKGEIQDVKEGGLNVLFINAIKQQQEQIETLQKQIERQNYQIDALKKLVCAENTEAAVCKETE